MVTLFANNGTKRAQRDQEGFNPQIDILFKVKSVSRRIDILYIVFSALIY